MVDLSARFAGKWLGTDEVSKPQTRKQRFRERSHVDNAPFAIQRFQCCKRRGEERHFKIVVIFDDQHVFGAGPSQKSLASLQWHSRHCWALVAGRRKYDVDVTAQRLRQQSRTTDGDGLNSASGLVQNRAQCGIARIFNRDCAPLVQQNLRLQPKRVLRPHCNKYFF